MFHLLGPCSQKNEFHGGISKIRGKLQIPQIEEKAANVTELVKAVK